jgi:hypothetical protein
VEGVRVKGRGGRGGREGVYVREEEPGRRWEGVHRG